MQGWIPHIFLQHVAVVSHATMPLRGREHAPRAKTDHSENSFHILESENHYKERLTQNSKVSPATPMCQQYYVDLLFHSKTGNRLIELEELLSFDKCVFNGLH